MARPRYELVNCPKCRKPLKKAKHKSRYLCENDACSVIFVVHPYQPEPIMRIVYKSGSAPRRE